MDYTNIRTDRQFRAASGMSKAEFVSLLYDFEQSFYELKGKHYSDYILEDVMETPKLKTLGDCLFFVLFQNKNDLSWDSLGAVFGLSGSGAQQNFARHADLLEQTLLKKK